MGGCAGQSRWCRLMRTRANRHAVGGCMLSVESARSTCACAHKSATVRSTGSRWVGVVRERAHKSATVRSTGSRWVGETKQVTWVGAPVRGVASVCVVGVGASASAGGYDEKRAPPVASWSAAVMKTSPVAHTL